MPIQPLVTARFNTLGNVSDYSHSSIYTSTHSDGLPTKSFSNLPALTTFFTPASSCANRWMMQTAWFPASLPSPGEVPTVDYTVFSTSPSATPSDPLWTSCQPFERIPTYSPGICPEGQTIAELTEHRVGASTELGQRLWQASCCQSGMTFGPYGPYCVSTFTTPFDAFDLLTTTIASGATSSVTEYEVILTDSVFTTIDGRQTLSTSVFTANNFTTIASGLAVAEPVVVLWQEQDVHAFPTNYATSLAQRWGVEMEGIATPAATSGAAKETDANSNAQSDLADDSLSMGTKVGIGVGVVVGVVIVGTIVFLLLLKQRRKGLETTREGEENMPELEEGHQSPRLLVGGRWRSEADGRERPQELGIRPDPVELEVSEKPVEIGG